MNLHKPSRRVQRAAALAIALVVTVVAPGCSIFCPAPTAPAAQGAALSTPEFLGPQQFLGTYVPRSHDVTHGGEATYDGTIVFTNVDRAIARAVLPAGLDLATPVSPTTQLHPIVFLYGHQRNTR